jgi:rod shape determining protein RodA
VATAPYSPSVRGFDDKSNQRRAAPAILRLDPLLMLGVLGLLACSLYAIETASKDDIPGQPYFYLYRQIGFAVVGLVLCLVISQFDYSRLREWRLGIYGGMIGAILLVYALAGATRGSKRWIDLGPFPLQPSEIGKVLLCVALAGFMVERIRKLGDRETTSRIVLIALLPAMLVIGQPDLGSGLVYIAITSAILFIAGTKWTHFAALGGLLAIAIVITLVVAPAMNVEVLKPYQVDRLTAFMDPDGDSGGQGYQLQQSIAGIGAGQKTGRGPDNATQTQLDFIPEHHTDFVFSVVGEAFGFVGCAIVLSLFALVIWRGLRILTMSKNLFGALIAGGIVAMIMFQMVVNIGMTIGIMPITGVPLPLMSYGGSSIITTLMAMGLLQSIHVQGKGMQQTKARELIS